MLTESSRKWILIMQLLQRRALYSWPLSYTSAHLFIEHIKPCSSTRWRNFLSFYVAIIHSLYECHQMSANVIGPFKGALTWVANESQECGSVVFSDAPNNVGFWKIVFINVKYLDNHITMTHQNHLCSIFRPCLML